MYKLAACCLLLIGCLHPLLSLPDLSSREDPLLLTAPEGAARPVLDEPGGALLLQELRGASASAEEAAGGRRSADASTNVFNPRGSMRKFQALSGQDPDTVLSHLLARIRRQHKDRAPPSECFWKYCV